MMSIANTSSAPTVFSETTTVSAIRLSRRKKSRPAAMPVASAMAWSNVMKWNSL